ncbi:MAG: tetratricopeptide repeat protein, partial [Acidobacteria bacterium]|nr:tetratricopeptide repeat protein [Acidobacteriota bacterium]
ATLRAVAAGPAAAPPLAPTVGGIADALAALGWYALRVVWPVPMAVFVTEVFSLPRAALGAVLLTGVAITAALGRRRGGGWVPLAIGAVLFLGPLLPTLVAVIGEFAPVVAAERYLYLPLAGCGLVCAAGLARLIGPWPASAGASGVALAAGVLFLGPAWRATQARVEIWADEERLWTLAVEQAPNVLLPHLNLALAYDRAGRADRALVEYARAVSAKGSDRGRALALSHFGAALLAQDRLAEAVAALSGSVALDPRAARTQYNLAHALVRQAERETDPASRDNLLHAALPHLEAALESDPGYTLARFQYGDVLAQLGQVEAGIAALEEGLRRSPGHPRSDQARRLLERLKPAPASGPPPGAADR